MASISYAVRNHSDDSVIVHVDSERSAVRIASEVRRGDFDGRPRECWVSTEDPDWAAQAPDTNGPHLLTQLNGSWTHNGFVVEPVKGTYRRASGGYCVDVRCSDPRTTATYWTAPADQVFNDRNYTYREV